jgi:hypothetical protein
VVTLVWNSVPVITCHFYTLGTDKSNYMQSWSDKNVVPVSSQLALAREILHRLKIANDRGALSPGELWFKNNLNKHSLTLASLKRTVDRMRSRIS